MNNYKIKVNNEAESKEAQELFFELGYGFDGGLNRVVLKLEYNGEHYFFAYKDDLDLTHTIDKCIFNNKLSHKEITLHELRDMVVLKRNDRKDATHTDQDNWKWYISSSGDGYVWQCGNSQQLKQWDKASLDLVDLKPIEKPMKEYLRKNSNGTYSYIGTVRPEHVSDFMIEIPEGCNIITCENRKGNLVYFHWKSLDSDEFFLKDEKIWSNNFDETLFDFIEKNEGEVKIIWQRPSQPEPLPFIDDEPKYTSASITWPTADEFVGDKKIYTHDELSRMSNDDVVNHPNHYTQGKVECIDALESATVNKVGIEAICTANAIKYLWRYEEKNGLEDVKKAQWYVNKLIDVLQQDEHS